MRYSPLGVHFNYRYCDGIYVDQNGDIVAFEEIDGKIHLRFGVCFKEIAKLIAFVRQLEIYGDSNGNMYCPYCGVLITEKNMSVDHIHPRDGGGTSDPKNLRWTCKKCNTEKSNISHETYLKIRNAPIKEKNMAIAAEQDKNKKLLHSGINYAVDNPEDIKYVKLSMLVSQFNVTQVGKGYYKKLRFYKEYKFFQNPILVAPNTEDERLIVLEGAGTLKVAKDLHLELVPVIESQEFIVDMDDSHFFL